MKKPNFYKTTIVIYSFVDPVENSWNLEDFSCAEKNYQASVASSETHGVNSVPADVSSHMSDRHRPLTD